MRRRNLPRRSDNSRRPEAEELRWRRHLGVINRLSSVLFGESDLAIHDHVLKDASATVRHNDLLKNMRSTMVLFGLRAARGTDRTSRRSSRPGAFVRAGRIRSRPYETDYRDGGDVKHLAEADT